MTTAHQMAAAGRGARKVLLGQVTSNKMQKTIVVRVTRLVRHPRYERVIRRSTSFKAHDEHHTAKPGDWVRIVETRPLSKDKRWRLVEIVREGSTAPELPPPPGEAEPSQEREG